ncbi:hypothetical protein [Marivirga sp.]|uniref:hypothetical protein n=1 Tax=Marivirga sp. TaxID=2018662 RepID=UPI003DA77B9F
MIQVKDSAQIEIKDSKQLEEWLADNHKKLDSIWVKTYSNKILPYFVSTPEMLEKIITFGWARGPKWRLDNDKSVQLILKRTSQPWSYLEKIIATRLMYSKKLHEEGKKAIFDAIKNGEWDCETFENEIEIQY